MIDNCLFIPSRCHIGRRRAQDKMDSANKKRTLFFYGEASLVSLLIDFLKSNPKKIF